MKKRNKMMGLLLTALFAFGFSLQSIADEFSKEDLKSWEDRKSVV